jgi:hypothetical protein
MLSTNVPEILRRVDPRAQRPVSAHAKGASANERAIDPSVGTFQNTCAGQGSIPRSILETASKSHARE